MSLAVRTMTARCTSPFFTRPRGTASLTETTITSPTVAVRRFEPPSTLMHWTRLAPLLSATSRLDCIWIMVQSSPSRGGGRFSAHAINDTPGLELRDRRAFLDADRLALMKGIGLVMSVIFLRTLDDLAVHRMLHPTLDLHDHRLVALVGNHRSGQHALRHILSLTPWPQRRSAGSGVS